MIYLFEPQFTPCTKLAQHLISLMGSFFELGGVVQINIIRVDRKGNLFSFPNRI